MPGIPWKVPKLIEERSILLRNVDARRDRFSIVRITTEFALLLFDSLSNMDNERDSRKVIRIDMGMRHRVLPRKIRPIHN